LAQIARECTARRYFLAVSNPCFELCLLLHFEDVAAQPARRCEELLQNKDQMLKSELAKHLKPHVELIDNVFGQTVLAIARARSLDVKPKGRWPSQLGTRVYRLVEQLIPKKG
jgi:hypothetical protein